jgi:MFS family permease
MLGGVLYGARDWKRDPAELIVIFAAPMAAGLATLALADSIPVMVVLLLVAGLFIAPSAAASFTLVGRLSPAGAVTRAFGWISTAVTAGFAAGGALSGALVQGVSVDAALLGPAGFSALAGTILFVRRATLRGATAGAASSRRSRSRLRWP